jgi:hypothetical protein
VREKGTVFLSRYIRIGRYGVLPVLFLCLRAAVYGEPELQVSGSIEWDKMELNATVNLNLASAGLKLPTGRSQAEEIIDAKYPALLRSHILSLLIDSSNTLADLTDRGDFSLRGAGDIALSANRTPPTLSPDLTGLSASYRIDLTHISARLIRHNRAMDIRRPLTPVPAVPYTGIIIIASGELPIHGRNSSALPEPCLFPKVWDTNMNLIYERNMLDPQNTAKTSMVRYVPEGEIFRPTPSGLSAELSALVGNNPLRILARGVFGVHPTDPIIDQEDALKILSLETNRRLLRDGRVVIVLNEGRLKSPLR